jgi:hypothetical protein
VIPALYLSHGAFPLGDDALWVSKLAEWSRELPTSGGSRTACRSSTRSQQVIDDDWMGLAKRSIELV